MQICKNSDKGYELATVAVDTPDALETSNSF